MKKNIKEDYKDFDEIIKARIENLSASNFTPTTESWNVLESKISKSEAEDTELNSALSKRLTDLKFEPQSNLWEKISSHLDDAENEDSAFDAVFSQKLKSIPTEFNPEHWKAFEPRINFFLRWQLRLKKYRVLEAAIFILTIFPVLKLYDEARREATASNNAVVSNSTSQGNSNSKSNTKNIGTNQLSAITNNANQSSIWSNVAETFSNFLNKTERSKFAIAESELEHNASSSFSPLALLGLNSKQISSDFVKQNSSAANSEQSNEEITNSLREIENKIWMNRNVQLLNQLPVPNLKETKIPLVGLIKTPKNVWRAGIATMINYDRITTKSILNGDTREEIRNQPSFSTGSVVSVQRGNTEIETGVIYSEKTYNPNQTIHISGSFTSGYTYDQLKDISAHIISIPINVKQNLYRNKKFRVYALAGATVSTIFAIDENRRVNDNFLQTGAPAGVYNPDIKADRLELPSYSNTASISRPLLSLNVGFGTEYKLGKRVSVFAQPVLKYQVSSNGIGSLNDKINSLSVEVGVKTTL